jgi:hypothetical protein
MSWGLLLLHAFLGCDSVSAFAGIDKNLLGGLLGRSTSDVWKSIKHLGPIFNYLSHTPPEITNEDIDELE